MDPFSGPIRSIGTAINSYRDNMRRSNAEQLWKSYPKRVQKELLQTRNLGPDQREQSISPYVPYTIPRTIISGINPFYLQEPDPAEDILNIRKGPSYQLGLGFPFTTGTTDHLYRDNPNQGRVRYQTGGPAPTTFYGDSLEYEALQYGMSQQPQEVFDERGAVGSGDSYMYPMGREELPEDGMTMMVEPDPYAEGMSMNQDGMSMGMSMDDGSGGPVEWVDPAAQEVVNPSWWDNLMGAAQAKLETADPAAGLRALGAGLMQMGPDEQISRQGAADQALQPRQKLQKEQQKQATKESDRRFALDVEIKKAQMKEASRKFLLDLAEAEGVDPKAMGEFYGAKNPSVFAQKLPAFVTDPTLRAETVAQKQKEVLGELSSSFENLGKFQEAIEQLGSDNEEVQKTAKTTLVGLGVPSDKIVDMEANPSWLIAATQGVADRLHGYAAAWKDQSSDTRTLKNMMDMVDSFLGNPRGGIPNTGASIAIALGDSN